MVEVGPALVEVIPLVEAIMVMVEVGTTTMASIMVMAEFGPAMVEEEVIPTTVEAIMVMADVGPAMVEAIMVISTMDHSLWLR